MMLTIAVVARLAQQGTDMTDEAIHKYVSALIVFCYSHICRALRALILRSITIRKVRTLNTSKGLPMTLLGVAQRRKYVHINAIMNRCGASLQSLIPLFKCLIIWPPFLACC